jgi:hypothetical protein
MRSIYLNTNDQDTQRCCVSRFRLFLAGVMALVLLGPDGASAEMSSCGGIDSSPQQKLVIDRLIADGILDTASVSAAYQAASIVVSNMKNYLRGANIRPIDCSGRWPRMDASDFGSDVVKALESRQVLFEVWGNLAVRRRGPTAISMAQGWVFYFMIPIPHSTNWQASQLHQHDYASRETSLRELFSKIFTHGRQFEVLASIAFAVRASRNENYDGAHAAFCHARLTLAQAIRKGTWKDSAIDAKSLASGIDALVTENLVAARRNEGYAGFLKASDISPHIDCPNI